MLNYCLKNFDKLLFTFKLLSKYPSFFSSRKRLFGKSIQGKRKEEEEQNKLPDIFYDNILRTVESVVAVAVVLFYLFVNDVTVSTQKDNLSQNLDNYRLNPLSFNKVRSEYSPVIVIIQVIRSKKWIFQCIIIRALSLYHFYQLCYHS